MPASLRRNAAQRRRRVTFTVAVMSTGWRPQKIWYMPGTRSLRL